MRILIVIPELSLGGTERQVVLLANALVEKGHTVRMHVLMPARRPFPLPQHLDIRQDRARTPFGISSLASIFKAVRAFRPDVVHSYMFGFDLSVNIVSKMLRVPCVVSSRRQIATWRKRRHIFWQGLGNRCVDAVVANSRAAAEYACVSEPAADAGNIYPIPNAYAPKEVDHVEEVTALPKSSGRIIVYTANLWKGKGHRDLLLAFSLLKKHQAQVHLWLVGDGPQRANLEQLCSDLGIAHNVHFLGRRYDTTTVLQRADVYVHASRSESSPNAILEAMAVGVPVVACACGGTPEMLEGGARGSLVAPGCINALAVGLHEAIVGGEEQDRRKDRAREAIQEQYDPGRIADRHLDVYERVLGTDTEATSVAFYTIGDGRLPSTWFRIIQYIPHLQTAGYLVRYHALTATSGGRIRQALGLFVQAVQRWKQLSDAKKYDLVIIQKGLSPARFRCLYRKLRRLNIPFMLDIDDAVHMMEPVTLPVPLRMLQDPDEPMHLFHDAKEIITGNAYLDNVAREASATTTVIPTVIDTDKYWISERSNGSELIVGWSGSSSTNKYLGQVLPVLGDLARSHAFRLLMISNDDRNIDGLYQRGFEVEFVTWRKVSEVQDLQRIDIGMMPLQQDRWSQGKCALKALQYMALGIPTVCSPVGVNADIIRDGMNGFLADDSQAWRDKLGRLLDDEALRRRMGRAARKTVEEEYSVRVHAQNWIERINHYAQ